MPAPLEAATTVAPDRGPAASRFRGSLPAFLVVAMLLVGAIVVGGLIVAAGRSDEQAVTERSLDLMRALLHTETRALGKTVTDYAWWDEALDNLAIAPNAEWAESNSEFLVDRFGITRVFVIDSENRAVFALTMGKIGADDFPARWQGGLRNLIDTARAAPPDSAPPATGILALDGLPYLVALAALTPEDDALRWPAARPRFLLGFARPLDAAYLGDLAGEFDLPGLRLGLADETADEAGLPLNGPDGSLLATLAWRMLLHQRMATKNLLGPVGAAFALMCLLSYLVMREIERGARQNRHNLTRIAAQNEELQNLAQLQEATLNSIGEGIMVLDRDLRLVDWNPALFKMFGYPQDLPRRGMPVAELIRHSIVQGQYGDARAEDILAERLARAARCEPATEEITLGISGHVLELRRSPMPDGGRVYTYRDITERKANERALTLARIEAERANRVKSDFIARMSHELRTPLNAIIGFSEMMHTQMVGPLNDVYRDYAGDINDSGKMLLSLVNDILDLAKVEAGHFELNDETVDVGDTMRSVGAILALRAGQAGVAVAFAPPPDPVRARADARALRQVMLNLLSNAIKFTPSGGRVSLTLDRCPKGGVRIAVADTGIGIAAADIARALEPFGQIRNDAIKVQEGTGLGLPISKALIELHGGTFALASKPGSGTTLTVTLPPERSLA